MISWDAGWEESSACSVWIQAILKHFLMDRRGVKNDLGVLA